MRSGWIFQPFLAPSNGDKILPDSNVPSLKTLKFVRGTYSRMELLEATPNRGKVPDREGAGVKESSLQTVRICLGHLFRLIQFG
jgi:hypothetical protein